MKTYKRIAASIATGAMALQMVTPAFALTIEVEGNGADTNQVVNVAEDSSRNVIQDNTTFMKTVVQLNGNTGGNSNNGGTGGESYTETGDATAGVHVSNMGNTNTAVVDNCDCDDDTSILVKGNGSDADTDVNVLKRDDVVVFQTNTLDLVNDIEVDLNTGDNESKDNTGSDVVNVTGDANAHIAVANSANANSAVIAGRGNGDTSVMVVGNGEGASSDVALGLASTALLTQANQTDIDNTVRTWLNTGNNTAKDNVAEIVGIGTGDAGADIAISNIAGINDAYFGRCDCDNDTYVKLARNGSDSESSVAAVINDTEDVFQNNSCGGSMYPMPWDMTFRRGDWGNWWDDSCFDNVVKADADTGNNESKDNTGSEYSDPMTVTGDSFLHADVENVGGANSYMSGTGWDGYGHGYHQDGSNVDLHVSFDLSALLSALMNS